ncbi:N-sulphoglucosamine sulphohydrolase [Stomoxys calcitrans]|uniref:N-sulphoglucosamine sulphohydrolase n=1 Tax=Stomoxys calcitrans TaxID=35570 RepID=UPI0027E2584C|nr:N-sulphoglucosamine sulphohydrolase [Stomoxys calcitrans]
MAILWKLLVLWLISTVATLVTAGEIKNVLLLLADDAGFEMGAYLNKYCQTPNLDKLARRGLLFNNAFTSVSSCSPSRAQILTGQVSHASGMYGLHQGVHNFNALPGTHSLPNVLREKSQGSILSGIIGKKHVGTGEDFKFDFEQTEEQHSINQIGRNITRMKLYAREFLKQAQAEAKPFFLMISFHDPHRCGHITPQYGEFCERWGSGEIGMGSIPDWRPIYYDWRNFQVPPYLPDTDVVRQELAAQYMTMSRLDQGVGLMLKELQQMGFEDNTLVIFTSDNGPPFPLGRTNLYEHGIRSPFIMKSPLAKDRHLDTTGAMASLQDIFPTVLDVFHLNNDNSSASSLYSKSLLPLLQTEPPANEDDAVFGSHNYHEITMDYPMRSIRTRRYKLIHNLNYWSYFPIDQDFYTSPTFQQIINATLNHQQLPWYKNLLAYYQRPEWELYDIKADSLERFNLAEKPKYKEILQKLRQRLLQWQVDTKDPWRCAPHAVLQEQGVFKKNPVCLSLGHEAISKPLTRYEKYVLI